MPPLMPVGELNRLALCLSSTNDRCFLTGKSPTGRGDVQHPS
ncbi:MAG TPA: hypothetical protein VFA09_01375 [Ktedonobacteraceae bacterium]|nr:hypothetical protein [Ktedonobacteraceae bacterium]HZU65901.1 hypothetical protein [Ktedonobacteraceae bacterium]